MKQRLVIFAPAISEPGGIATRTRLLAADFAGRGWEVRALLRSGDLVWPKVRREQGVTFVEFPGFGRPRLGAILYAACATPLGILWGLRARASLSVQLMSTSLVAAACSRVTRTPLIAMSTTGGELGEVKYLVGTRSFALRRWLLACVSNFVAQTPEVARELGSLVDPRRVVVLPNPMPRIDTWPELAGKPRVMYAGRLSRRRTSSACSTPGPPLRRAVRALC